MVQHHEGFGRVAIPQMAIEADFMPHHFAVYRGRRWRSNPRAILWVAFLSEENNAH
jgi:hypothetical protein